MSARVAFAGRLGTTYVVPPVPGLRNPGVQLFLTSALVLFVELFLIRWISATVTYVGFFTRSRERVAIMAPRAPRGADAGGSTV